MYQTDGATATVLTPSAGAVGLQDYALFGPWMKLAINAGVFKTAASGQVYILFTLPSGVTPSTLNTPATQVDVAIFHATGSASIQIEADIYRIAGLSGLPDGYYIVFSKFDASAFPADTFLSFRFSTVLSVTRG